jgi:hypothetical protein
MVRAALAFLLGAALLAPTTADAQSRWERQVRDQIKRAGRILEDRGFELSHDTYTGSLGNQENESLTLSLRAGTDYAIIGVCDEDCTDIDLRLFDEDGDEIDSDLETDDNPVVQVSPRSSGKYRIKVVMATCSTSPCFYGVGVFSK